MNNEDVDINNNVVNDDDDKGIFEWVNYGFEDPYLTAFYM